MILIKEKLRLKKYEIDSKMTTGYYQPSTGRQKQLTLSPPRGHIRAYDSAYRNMVEKEV